MLSAQSPHRAVGVVHCSLLSCVDFQVSVSTGSIDRFGVKCTVVLLASARLAQAFLKAVDEVKHGATSSTTILDASVAPDLSRTPRSHPVSHTPCCMPMSFGLRSAANHVVLTDGTCLGIKVCFEKLESVWRWIDRFSTQQQASAVDSNCQDGECSKLGARAMGGGA